MSNFTFHTIESAPEASKPWLEKAKQGMGFLPNLYTALAESPIALEAYLTLSDLMTKTSFTPQEQQIIMLAASVENECDYCVAAHSSGARMFKVDKDVVEAIRNDEPFADAKLQALRAFVQATVRDRGRVDKELQDFFDAGYNKQQALEVVFGVAMKTLSNYANHLVDTPVDSVMEKMAWSGRKKL